MKTDRRDFIKKAGIAGAGLAVTMSPFGKALAQSVTNKKVRLGIIGPGGRGRFLMEHLLVNQKECNFELVALCDNYQPSLDKALELGNKYKVTPKTFKGHKEMIKQVPLDGVIVATPLHEHAHISIDCMNAGIHVLCEKSMARTLDDVKAMYDTHVKTGAILLIGHQRLFSDKYHHAMGRIHKGELGQIGQIKAYWHRNNNWRRPVPKDKPELERKINWRLYKEYSAGTLTELMSHQLQVANWAMQKTPVSVMGSGSIHYYKDGREVNDNLAAIFKYDDGTHFMYDNLAMNQLKGCEELIIGDYGTMSLETNNFKSETPPKPEPAPGIIQMVRDIEKGIFSEAQIGGASWALETAVNYNGEKIYEGFKGDGTREELINFANMIRNAKMPEWMLKEAYNASIWTLLTEQAIESGQLITCPEKYRL